MADERDTRECGFVGCGRRECADHCAGIPQDAFEFTTAELTPRSLDRHRGWFRRLKDLIFRPGPTAGGER